LVQTQCRIAIQWSRSLLYLQAIRIMHTTVSAAPARPRWRWKRLVVCVCLLIGVPVAYMWYSASADRRELEETLRELDRTDPGWRLEDLRARHQAVPDERSAAKQILRVQAAALGDIEASGIVGLLTKIDMRARNAPLTEAEVARLAEFFTREAAARAEAFNLKDLSEGAFAPASLEDGRLFQEARKVRVWLYLDAFFRAEEEDGDGAMAACRGMLNTVRAVGVEPGGQGLQWCKQFHPVTVTVLERILAQTQPCDEELQRMQAALEREATLDLRQALRERRAEGWRAIERALAGDYRFFRTTNRMFSRSWLIAQFSLMSAGDAISYLRGMNRLIEAAEPPLDGRLDELQDLIRAWEITDPAYAHYVGCADQAIFEHYWSQTYLRQALTAVAAERYRRKNGRWPAALGDLAKAEFLRTVPVDPVDGRPLRWDHQPDGVSMSSTRYSAIRLWDPPARRQGALAGP
jgi:hypothetical protein